MRAIKPGGTREQQAVGDWLDAAALVRGRLDPTAEQVPAILPYFDCLTDAVASLGLVDNFPFWKLLILAAWLGWWIVFLVVCSAFGCSPTVGVFWTLINISHLLFFVLFC